MLRVSFCSCYEKAWLSGPILLATAFTVRLPRESVAGGGGGTSIRLPRNTQMPSGHRKKTGILFWLVPPHCSRPHPSPPIGVSGAHILAEANNQAVPLRGRAKHELNLFGRSMWSACASKNRQSRSRLKGRRGPQEMFIGCVLAVSITPRFSGRQGLFCMDSEINQGSLPQKRK